MDTPRNYFVVTLMGDIVAIDDKPAKGMYVGRTRVILADTGSLPGSGKAIADVKSFSIREHMFEILDAGGSPIGTIMSTGLGGGSLRRARVHNGFRFALHLIPMQAPEIMTGPTGPLIFHHTLTLVN